jgi:hypothetical protein
MARFTIAALLAAVATAALVAGCGGTGGPSAPDNLSTTSSQPGTTRPADVDVRKLMIDPTKSSAAAFATNVLTAVAEDLVRRYPVPSAEPKDAQPAVRGLDLFVRTVSTHCYSTTAQSLEQRVPAVRALAPPPALDDQNLAQDELDWTQDAIAWREAATQASSIAVQVADELRHLQLERNTSSAISACFAALANSGPQDPDVTTLAATDLQNNQPEITANLRGGPVVVIQSCPANADLACQSLASKWIAELKHQGSGPVTIVRADAASSAIAQWLGVTP